jgi:hypothetical protein
LRTFKSSAVEAVDALQGLQINEEDFDEEYDFMDESGDETNTPRRTDPKLKYMRLLQHVADRTVSQITIDLDDLDAVGFGDSMWRCCVVLTGPSTKRLTIWSWSCALSLPYRRMLSTTSNSSPKLWTNSSRSLGKN